MSAEEDGRGDDSRERRGDNGRRNTPPGRGGGARGRPGGSGDRRSGGPRQGTPRAGGAPGGRGRPAGGGWKGKDGDARGKRDDRKPGRPFKRSDDRRPESRDRRPESRERGPESRDRRPEERRDGRPGGPRGERREGRFDGPRGGERREGRPPASRGGPRPARSGGPGREGRPGGRPTGGGQGERRFQDRDGRGGRDERRPGARRFEGRREGRPGDRDRDRPFKARGGPKRPQDGGGRPYGPRGDRPDRRTRTDERERPAPRHDDPILPDDVTGEELDVDARAELRTLPKELAAKVARHLVMAGRLAEEEPERAYKHARAARRLASRVGVVREAAGIAAYHAGEWAEALAELRAARRLSAGDVSYLPVMVDCERGLGRPERALELVKSPEAQNLDPMGRVELRIVESGVRRDLGQYDAAVVTLQIPELRDRRLRPWSARLFYAYADALAEAGRQEEASDWFARAAAADRDGDTDAAERYAELEGLHIIDTEDGDVEDAGAEETGTEEAGTEEAGTEEAGTGGSDVEEPSAEAAGAEEGGVEGADSEDEAGPGDVPAAEGAPATGIAFKAADPEVPETSGEDAPDVPAVFLEPKPAEGERPPDAG